MAEKQVKIGAKLTDSRTREYLWAEQYQRDLAVANLIGVQEDIAQRVAATLASEYGIIPQRLSQNLSRKAPRDLGTYEAILSFYHYEYTLSPESYANAMHSLQAALEREPDCATAAAMLATLFMNQYALDFPGMKEPLGKAATLIDQAVLLEPGNQAVQIVFARFHFLCGDKESFLAAINAALSLNPNSNLRLGSIGFFLCLYGEWERGKPILDQVMHLNPTFPNWYYGPIVLYHYRKKDYEAAYEQAVKYNMEHNFWGPLLRAATLGQLNRLDQAKNALSEVTTIRPDLKNRARLLISRFVKEDALVDHILQGLHKAGLERGFAANTK